MGLIKFVTMWAPKLRFLMWAVIFCAFCSKNVAADDFPVTDLSETNAIFDVLHAINDTVDWRTLFPGDFCTGAPHGINCDVFLDQNNTQKMHIVEINLGYVSEAVNNPICTKNASFHPSLFKFAHLKKLFIYQCFTGAQVQIPHQISDLAPSLQHLAFLFNSALVGSIPAQISNLTHLERIVFLQNGLEGKIPDELGSLTNLKQLAISHNKITGAIPASIGKLTDLAILDLSGNKITGQIPDLSALSKLVKLDLSQNAINGPIPESIGKLKSLELLDIKENNLVGPIPAELGQLESLRNLAMGDNPLGCSIPEELGNLKKVELFRVSNADLVGSIPETLGNLQSLNALALDNNRLTGPIPASFGALFNLYYLNLGSNQLSGAISLPAAQISKLGRNLIIKNNAGLCNSIQDRGDGVSGARPVGLSQCTSSSTSLVPGTNSEGRISSSIANSASKNLGFSVALLILAISWALISI